MDSEFVSYAYKDLPHKKIKKYAVQYDGVDMTEFLGADEDNFPFLLRVGSDDFNVMIWNAYSGFLQHLDEDQVREYATVKYLLDHAYPVFDSMTAAQKWAEDHDWPRKQLGANQEVQ